MSDLTKRITQLRAAANTNDTRPKKDLKIPEYGQRGEIIRKELRIPKWLVWTVASVLLAAAVLYVPALPFVRRLAAPSEQARTLTVDASVIRTARDYLQDNPSADFDGDHLLNEQEVQRGTNPYKADTDKDGISDYVELYVYDSNPLSPSNDLVSYVKAVTAEEGKSVGTPFKINDVVLWPDDWNSRAKGGVVKTINGYRFCGFRGWVQFPFDPVYAYQVVNGVHVPLPYREAEKAWRVVDENEVLLFPRELEEEFEISVLGSKHYYDMEGWQRIPLKVMEFLLPSNSILISARTATLADRPDTVKPVVELKPVRPSAEYPVWRFDRSMNNLSDLAAVYGILDEGRCLLASFYLENEGEALAEVYGYDASGGLLLCDIDTLQPIDTLRITERMSKVMLTQDQVFVSEWFSFTGCGLDSTKKNIQIRFFDWIGEGETEETDTVEWIAEEIQEPETTEVPEAETAEEAGEAETSQDMAATEASEP